MDAAAERRVPVVVDCMDFNNLHQFLERFPKNIVIRLELGGKWGHDRYLRPLLEEFEHFYMDIAGYWVPEGISDLVGKYGDDRILFGSNFPHYLQGSPMLQLKHGNLSDASLRKIAGQNLLNLLEGAML